MIFSFVVTNYNNTHYTVDLVNSINNFIAEESAAIIIVDNASEPKEKAILKILQENNSNVTVLYLNENRGYFPGLNLGISHVRTCFPDCQYLIVGNNDLLFPVDFLSKLKNKLPLFDQYPVVSPDIITLEGFHQNPHVVKGISKVREMVYNLYHMNYYLARSIVKLSSWTNKISDRKDEEQYPYAQEIYQGYGACYILGPVFFQNFKQLWAPTFLTHEEYFLSRQLSDKGFRIYYEPTISLTHRLHGTTKMLPGKMKWLYSRLGHKEYRKYVKIF